MRFAILLPFIVGCATDPAAPPTTHESDPWAYLALPALQEGQCITCHAGTDELGFLAGANKDAIRAQLLGSGQVDLDDHFASGILTKGVHEGNALTEQQAQAIVYWLATE